MEVPETMGMALESLRTRVHHPALEVDAVRKKISRKLVMTYICIALVFIITMVGAAVKMDFAQQCWIIAVACGVYSAANVGSKLIGGDRGSDGQG